MIVLRLSSDGFLGWMKSHEALLHSLPLQVKFLQIFQARPSKNLGWVDRWVLEVNIPKLFLSLAAVSPFAPLLGFFCLWRLEELVLLAALGVVGSRLSLRRYSGLGLVSDPNLPPNGRPQD